MKFQDVSLALSQIEATTLRNEKTVLLAKLLKDLQGEELGIVCYLVVGRLGPLYDQIEFNLAGKMTVRAVAWAVEKSVEVVGEDYKDSGDLGDVIEEYLEKETSNKTVSEVYLELRGIAEDSGAGSQERKVRRLGVLLGELDKLSAKYIVRLVVGKLRLGFSDVTVLDALSVMKKGDKSERKALEGAFNVRADLAEVAEIYKDQGVKGIETMDVEPGVPIRPAKAERLGTMVEIVEKLGEMSVEPKYDGMRVQIHAYRGTTENGDKGGLFGGSEDGVVVKIFSRGMENISHMFPDIVKGAKDIVWKEEINGMVLDAEVVALDTKGIIRSKNRAMLPLLSFQETIKRKRKHGVGKTSEELPLMVVVFDLLYLDMGLLNVAYAQRRKMAGKLIKYVAMPGYDEEDAEVTKLYEYIRHSNPIVMTDSFQSSNVAAMNDYFLRVVDGGLEGLVCKKLDSIYQAGARNFNWVKYKKAHESDLADTLDCVVMGYYKGKGKRQGFGLGAFLVGVLGSGEEYKTVAKIGTGLTDAQWKEMWERMQKCLARQRPGGYDVAKGLIPDGWVEPKIVVEIEADEITKSPIHSAGYALRFPRLLRFRDDKNVNDITKRMEVEDIFKMKTGNSGTG